MGSGTHQCLLGEDRLAWLTVLVELDVFEWRSCRLQMMYRVGVDIVVLGKMQDVT